MMCNDRFLIRFDHLPVKRGQKIIDPYAERRKIPVGVVKMLPPGYEGEIRLGERYFFQFHGGKRVDKEHIALKEEEIFCRIYVDREANKEVV